VQGPCGGGSTRPSTEHWTKGRVVGSVVLVRDQGMPVYARAAGYADREAGIPVVLDSVFRWASLTKPVVAAAVLVLMERGRLDLDDRVWPTRSRPT
jgi:CubicO group peptidase (beta-lactamase class C family)